MYSYLSVLNTLWEVSDHAAGVSVFSRNIHPKEDKTSIHLTTINFYSLFWKSER